MPRRRALEQYLWVAHDGAGDGAALLPAPRQLPAARPAVRRVAVLEPHEEVVRVGVPRRVDGGARVRGRLVGAGGAVADVVGDAGLEPEAFPIRI